MSSPDAMNQEENRRGYAQVESRSMIPAPAGVGA